MSTFHWRAGEVSLLGVLVVGGDGGEGEGGGGGVAIQIPSPLLHPR